MVDGPTPSLTPRELEVLQLVALGKTHKDIAQQLVTTPKGITPTVNRVMKKLGASNAPHAVFLAVRFGLLDPRRRHGDHAGFAAHRYRGEEPCEACWEGELAYRRAYQAERRAAARAVLAEKRTS